VVASVYHMNYFQAIIIGLVQGFTELFPISSLGHTVLIPSWIGGTWGLLVRQESMAESPYLAFVVGLHLATAIVLLGFYLREWIRLIIGFFRSLFNLRVETPEERLAWLIVIGTVPVGIIGLEFEHQFRVLFAKPVAAAVFLMLNGLVLFAGEWAVRRQEARTLAGAASSREGVLSRTTVGADPGPPPGRFLRFRNQRIVPMDEEAELQLSRIGFPSAAIIGAAQALALLAGFSREGVTMVGGLFRGLNRENALRFAFLLSTPVIFAAGALKIPDLLGPHGNGIRPQVLVGSVAAAAASLVAVIFLSQWFKTRTLKPFAVYSLLFGLASVVRFGVF
jgi:undecaprenyl-diphosphatase